MITVLPRRDGSGAEWRLISRTDRGADVLATAAVQGGDGTQGRVGLSWHDAVRRLRDGDGDVDLIATADGHFQWVLKDPGSCIIAQSPAVYRDADECRAAFAAARRAARAVLGAGSSGRSGDTRHARSAGTLGGVRRR